MIINDSYKFNTLQKLIRNTDKDDYIKQLSITVANNKTRDDANDDLVLFNAICSGSLKSTKYLLSLDKKYNSNLVEQQLTRNWVINGFRFNKP